MKEITDKMKRQPSEWEKIFANEETCKGLVSRTDKQLMQSIPKKKKKKKKAMKKMSRRPK